MTPPKDDDASSVHIDGDADDQSSVAGRDNIRGDKDGEDAAFGVSFDLLSEPLQKRWAALAVFPADFDLDAAAAVWEAEKEDARLALEALINASLVEWDADEGRARLHDLARDYAAAKASESEAETAARIQADEESARLTMDFPNAGVYVLNLRLAPAQKIPWLEAALAEWGA